MKKIILSLIITLIIFNQSNAQETQDTRGYFGISLGPSIPMGDMASKDPNNEAAGWAKSGAVFDLTFAYKLGGGKLGVMAMLRGMANPTDAQAIADELANQEPYVQWNVESASWGNGSLLIGCFGSFPVSAKISFDARAMFGLLSSSSPEMTITGESTGGMAWVKQSTGESTTVDYLLGAGFRFALGSKIYLLTNVDYLGAKPEFKSVEILRSDGTRYTNTWRQSMGTLNMTLGVAYRF